MPQSDESPGQFTPAVSKPGDCPFCNLQSGRIIDRDGLGMVVRDAYPISPGHTLVIPVRHVASFFNLSETEHVGLRTLLLRAKVKLDAEHAPDGYNVGINDGPAAGQTVPHLHIHLIPRFDGDREDPRGGVRWLFPEKADYWSTG